MGNLQFFTIVSQQNSFLLERFGRFKKILSPGLHFFIPFVDKIAYRQKLMEQSIEISSQEAITKDNVLIHIDGVLYLRITDPYKASYQCYDPINYCYILAQSIMRSQIGKITLDTTFEERQALNGKILEQISQITINWGVTCFRYEIKNINMSPLISKVMNLQAESERVKRAEILRAEGEKQSLINEAEGIKDKLVYEAEGKAQSYLLNAISLQKRISYIATLMEDKNNKSLNYQLKNKLIDSLNSLANKDKTIVMNKNLKDFDNTINSVN